MKNNRHIKKRNETVLVVAAYMLFLVLMVFLIKKNPFSYDSEEANVEMVTGAIGLLGTLLIIFELRTGKNTNSCYLLNEMNQYFFQNPRIALLYRKLEECYREPSEKLVIDNDEANDIHTDDIVAYFCFFETFNEFLKHRVLSIKQIDDLFGYRFFILMHNKQIQKNEIYAVPSSYANIFELYDEWIGYRKETCVESSRLVVMEENMIPDEYIKNHIYVSEGVKEKIYFKLLAYDEKKLNMQNSKGEHKKFYIKLLQPYDIDDMLELQKTVKQDLKDEGKDELLILSSEHEITDSLFKDVCLGVCDGEKLVAFCIIVLNRNDRERNLCFDIDEETKPEDYITLDTVQVGSEFRGYGIQNLFIEKAVEVANMTNAKFIASMVSPKNKHSRGNLSGNGFCLKKKFNKGEFTRDIMVKDVKGER